MKKTLTLTALAAVAAVWAAPASATISTYSATLNGAAEVPPNGSTANALALVTFDDAALTVAVNTIFIGLTGGPASAAHIHCCTAVAGAGTVGVFTGFTGFPAATTGSYTSTFTLGAASFSTLITGTAAGKAYVNIHNTTFPGGEIRGFLVSTAPVPEPGTYAMMLGGLAAIGFLSRRRRLS